MTSGLHQRIVRVSGDGFDLVEVPRPGVRELHLTLRPLPGEQPAAMAARLAGQLREHGAQVLRHEMFGSLAACAEARAGLREAFGEVDWPVLCAEGRVCNGGALAGMHVFAVAGPAVESVSLDGRVVGRMFDDGHARHCLLGDVLPGDLSQSHPAQARQVFEKLEAALARVGMTMTNVVRTWLFLDDILDWYEPLNHTRRDFFAERKLFGHLLPASTGVGMRNPAGAALVAGAWAVEGTNGAFSVREVASPLQCPAPEYGSCFSRAVEMVTPGCRRLLVSGTASIEPKGASVCAGDVDGQIDLTMQVVRQLLVSCGMDYPDLTRATAYLRHPRDRAVWEKWFRALGLDHHPLITTQAVICRDELLFEIELDALVAH